MNNLSVLRVPYIQNSEIDYMVEQELMCTSCREDSSFGENGLSWKDLQGLSWLLCEECIQSDNLKTSFACA